MGAWTVTSSLGVTAHLLFFVAAFMFLLWLAGLIIGRGENARRYLWERRIGGYQVGEKWLKNRQAIRTGRVTRGRYSV
jgi:uncharacterized membrane-anchored protein